MGYLFQLDNPEATVEIDEGQGVKRQYKHGDVFEMPPGWKFDAEFSRFVKRPTFSFETRRSVRNVKTGANEWEIDTKRISLPVVEA